MKISCLLLVDDDDKDIETILNDLEIAELEVEEIVVTRSLAEAIDCIKKRKLDIILLDMDLSDSKSIATVEALRKFADAVIIVLSQSDDELLGIQALEAGADDFLVRSRVDAKALRSSIVYSITRYKLRTTTARINEKINKLSGMAGV